MQGKPDLQVGVEQLRAGTDQAFILEADPRQARTLHAGARQAIAELLPEQAGLAAAAHADHRQHLAG